MTTGAGVSQTGTQTAKTGMVQLRADQAPLAGEIARQQEQRNATRTQICCHGLTAPSYGIDIGRLIGPGLPDARDSGGMPRRFVREPQVSGAPVPLSGVPR